VGELLYLMSRGDFCLLGLAQQTVGLSKLTDHP
jgi:hypothetical protein